MRTLFTRRTTLVHNRSRSSLPVFIMAGILLMVGAGLAAAAPRDLYVAPLCVDATPGCGLPTNDGSLARPFDLATVLANTKALPGDTLWLRGGTYVGNFTSYLAGTPTAPVTLRQFPGERATLDARSPTGDTLSVLGNNAVFWGFEIANSSPTRSNGTALGIYGGANSKFINLIVHEGGASGVGFWSTAVNAELYGSIISNNGFDAPDRGHGHSVYTQNQSGTKLITDNIMFNSFSFGIHAYTEGGTIDNFDIEGNILFNHGMASSVSGAKSNLLLGGSQVAHHALIKDNYTYYPRGTGGRGADIGYGVACDSSSVQNNYFVGDTAINLNCSATTFSGNWLYGGVNSNISPINNTVYTSRPTGVLFVRPNKYEPGRANVAIYNWGLLSQVPIDLSGVKQNNGQPLLNIGQGFEIRDAQNFFAPPIVVGTYTGAPIPVRMTGLTAQNPVSARPAIHTAPEFGAFVILPLAAANLTASLGATPSSVLLGQTTMLSWSTLNATTATIDQGIGAVAASGTRVVSPTSTTTYTLTAQDQAGHSITRSTTVTVSAPSADGTMVPPLTQLVDATGGVWTLASNGNVLRNGTWVGGGLGTKLLWAGGIIYTLGIDSNWWQWQSTSGIWVKIGPTQPGISPSPVPSPSPPPPSPSPPSASADGAMVPPLTQLVDATSGIWTLASNGNVLRNGTWVGNGVGSKLLWSGGTIYTLGTDSNWWRWQPTSGTWVKVGPTQPGTSSGTPPSTSPNGAMVSPLTKQQLGSIIPIIQFLLHDEN